MICQSINTSSLHCLINFRLYHFSLSFALSTSPARTSNMSFRIVSILSVVAAAGTLVHSSPLGPVGSYPPPEVGGQAGTLAQCNATTNPSVRSDDCFQAVQQALGTGTSNTVITHVTGSCQISYVPFEQKSGQVVGNAELSGFGQQVVKDCCRDGACPTGPAYLESGALHSMGWALAINTPGAPADYDPPSTSGAK